MKEKTVKINEKYDLSKVIGEFFDLKEVEKKVTSLIPYGIKLKPVLKAISVAKELGLNFIPKAWIVYIQTGWRIVDRPDGFTWLKPLPSGTMSAQGLVVDLYLDVNCLLDTKRDLGVTTVNVLRDYFPKKQDIGKIFFIQTEAINQKGQILDREDFLKINPNEVHSWVEVSELDVIDVY